VRLDDDDARSICHIRDFRNYPNIEFVVGPRVSLPEMTTTLTHRSRGRWLCYFNDDAVIIGEGWDSQLGAESPKGAIYQPEIYQLNESKYQHATRTGFPFFPNGCWVDFQCGHDFIPNPADYMVAELAEKFHWQIKFLKGITIFHDRHADDTLPRL